MFLLPKESTAPLWTRLLARPYLIKLTGLLLILILVLSPWGFSSDSGLSSLTHYRIKVVHEGETEAPGPSSSTYNDAPTSTSSSADVPQFTAPAVNISAFWGELSSALFEAEPEGEQIVSPRPLEVDTFSPFSGKSVVNLDVLQLPEEQFNSLKENHQTFVQNISDLASDLPFEHGTRGVVITAKGDLFGIAVTAILMMRRVGCKLPVQLFLNDASEHERKLCKKSLSKLDVQCLNMEDFLQLPNAPAPELERFQFKVFSIIFSTFQHVLFLDADAFPIRKPDYLFDVEPYTSHGLVTWPDFWLPTISPLFYNIAGVATPNNTIDSRASESGMMLYDKARHADSLLLAAYYNFYGRYYFQLHSQGAWGSGDKETFLQAALVLGNPYYQVKTNARVMTKDDINYGSGIWQADPEWDWKKHNKTTTKRDENKKTTTMFAHLNRVKVDARRLNKLIDKEDEEGNKDDGPWSRIWGPDSSKIVKTAGYDLEKAIWQEIIKVNCDESLLVECDRIRDYYEEVFTKHV
ncbi:hypothetical protein NM208_g8089 [Fusarium decemcellulare]|uniref:Uncharacterized protein n=1 Tax=Fusarium decemcellulare TaxID=57161 RepID=A0ACC1S6V7_9HYPO|nr:hypothetical protein NM208_g8089 [Fusarium decemcellulare]